MVTHNLLAFVKGLFNVAAFLCSVNRFLAEHLLGYLLLESVRNLKAQFQANSGPSVLHI